MNVFEHRDQLEIPFDGTEPSVHNKPWHVHFSDFIEKVGKTGHLKHSSKSTIDLLREHRRMGVIMAIQEHGLLDPALGYAALVSIGVLSENDNKEWDYDDVAPIIEDRDKVDLEELADAICQIIDNQEYGIIDDYTNLVQTVYDQDEYIEIFRVLSPGGEEFKDVFMAADSYGGVGIYWAYEEDKAQSYWSSSTDHGGEVILRARVSPMDVDWVDTIALSLSQLSEEHEIRTKENVMINLVSITYSVDSKENTVVYPDNFMVPTGVPKR